MKVLYYLILVTIFLVGCCSNESQSNSEFKTVKNINKEVKVYENGIYNATVNYYNPKTNYSATYTLEVKVENNKVVIIYFPNKGYLDSNDIKPEEINENGFVRIIENKGKTYDIQIN